MWVLKNLHRRWFSCEEELKNPAWFHLQRSDFPPLEDEVKHVTCRAAIFDPPGGAERKMEEKMHRSGRMRICRQGDKKQGLTSMGLGGGCVGGVVVFSVVFSDVAIQFKFGTIQGTW